MAKKPSYHIRIVITTGPEWTPVDSVDFEGRKRAFKAAAAVLLNVWQRTRRFERGEMRQLGLLTFEEWQDIYHVRARGWVPPVQHVEGLVKHG